MPQLDIFTFFGQVTWFVAAFVTYFIVVGAILLPTINRSIKLRTKKRAYQLSFGKDSLDASSYDSTLVRSLKEIQSSLHQHGKSIKVSGSSSMISSRFISSI